MLTRTLMPGLALAIAVSHPARAEILTLECTNAKAAYRMVFDSDRQSFVRQEGDATQPYRIVRTQFDKGDGLVWVSRDRGGDVLAFFGSKTMVKYFYGNGSETTDACTQK